MRAKGIRTSITALILVPFVLFNLPVLFMTFFRPPQALFNGLMMWIAVYPFYIWQFSSLIIVLLILLGQVIKLPATGVTQILKSFSGTKRRMRAIGDDDRYKKFDRSRRVFVRTVFWASSAYVVGGSSYGIFLRNKYEVSKTELQLKNLPHSLKGLTVGMISDIHAGPYMLKEEIDEYVRVLNSLKPDIIFVPGDFVTILPSEIYPVAESLSSLRAPLGVYGCLGNHEFYSRAPDEITKRLEDAGIRILRNESVRLDVRGSKFTLLGIDDLGHGDNFADALQGVVSDDFKILLSHKPYFFPQAAEAKIDLVLAGHTHGGQVVFVKVGNFALAPATFVSRYVAGLYDMRDSSMYVSRGVGTIGVPFRINCPPEVTFLRLT